MEDKQRLRAEMRNLRGAHVAALPDATRALLFMRPPAPIVELAPEGSVVGIYFASVVEAPTRSWAKWFRENGRTVALPWFADRTATMRFREWTDPYADSDLEAGPFGLQPHTDAAEVVPALAIVPLLAFTADGARLGQGGGHYDRWLAANPDTLAIGLAWDCQHVDSLPVEAHDRHMRLVVTPTRIWHGQD